MSLIVWKWYCFAFVLFILLRLLYSHYEDTSASARDFSNKVKELRTLICFNRSQILHLQRDQLKIIRKEILEPSIWSKDTLESLSDNTERLYSYAYKLRAFDLANFHQQDTMKNRVIVFSDIYKNANDNMRYYLCNYLHFVHGNTSTMCTKDIYIKSPTDPISCRLNMNANDLSKPHETFVFAVVRHPIHRLVSALTEIESRGNFSIYKEGTFLKDLKPFSPVGSMERVLELIRLFIHEYTPVVKGRVRKQELTVSNFSHTNPEIGTLVFSKLVYNTDPHLYRLEDFDNELQRFSRESGLVDFYKSYVQCNRTDMMHHASSDDLQGVKVAAESLLSYASPDAFQEYGFKLGAKRLPIPTAFKGSSIDFSNLARTYYKALCRLYLTDFICTDYDLPLDCRDILYNIRVL